MYSFLLKTAILLALLNSGCTSSSRVASRLQSGVPATASVTLRVGAEPANDLQFVHNKDVSNRENFKLDQLTIDLLADSLPINLDGGSTQISLPPIMFSVKLSAVDGGRKLLCDASKVSLGTLPINCSLEGGTGTGQNLRGPDQEIANYIKTQKDSIAGALYFVETNVLNTKLPPEVSSRWQSLERDIKVGGGLHGVPDAVASTIRGWNVGLDYDAEGLASILVNIYNSDSSMVGADGGSSQPFVGPPKPKTCYCTYSIYSNENDDGSVQGSKEESRGFLSQTECMKHIDGKMYPLSWDSFYRYDSCSLR